MFLRNSHTRLGRDFDLKVLAQLVTMVDRTTYSDEARTPKIALRQIFGRLGLRQELCKLAADSGLLSVEVVAMLGDTAAAVKESIKTLVDAAVLGADDAARELSLMQLAAVWHACHALQTQFATRRAKMEEDPSKVPEMAQEDHAEFQRAGLFAITLMWFFWMRRSRARSLSKSSAGISWCMGWSPTTQRRRSEPNQTPSHRRQGSLELQKISSLFRRQMNLIRSRTFTLF